MGGADVKLLLAGLKRKDFDAMAGHSGPCVECKLNKLRIINAMV
jgi:hypothetical protein